MINAEITLPTMRWTVILRYIGTSLLMLAFLMAVSGLVAAMNGGDRSMVPLFYSAGVTFITGAYPLIFVRQRGQIETREGYYIVVLSWITCCLFGMLPYLFYGDTFSFTDALFESVSGFTTTGASILDDIEALPMGLHFWRMSTAWVGGIGIVTLFSMMISKKFDRNSVLSGTELSGLARSQSSSTSSSGFARKMIVIYVGMTVVCSILLWITGLEWFDAVTCAMSTCSTCGFCIRNASIAAYDNVAAEIVMMVFMVTCGISFVHIYNFLRNRRNNRLIKNEIIKTYLTIIAVATALITADLVVSRTDEGFWQSLRESAFQVCSLITTTGFATADTDTWPALSILILVTISIFCGCSGSTAGGFKMDRLVITFKNCVNEIHLLRRPNEVRSVKLNGRILHGHVSRRVFVFLVLYVALIAVGSMVNVTFGADMRTGLTAAVACAGNVGPGFGLVGSVSNYAALPDIIKYNSMALMILGRLEIFPVLYLLGFRMR